MESGGIKEDGKGEGRGMRYVKSKVKRMRKKRYTTGIFVKTEWGGGRSQFREVSSDDENTHTGAVSE